MAISGLNTGQVLTVKNLTIGGHYTTTQAIADDKCLIAKDLSVYDYNPITKYELKVYLHISSGDTYLFLPNDVGKNDFVAVVPETLSTVLLGDESSYNNYNNQLMNIYSGSSYTSGGIYSMKEEWTSREFPLLWQENITSHHWSTPARLASWSDGWNCYNVGNPGINDFVRFKLGHIPQLTDTVLSFTSTTKQSRSITYNLQMYDPDYGGYWWPDFYYGWSGFTSCQLFGPHHTCFTMEIPFAGPPTIYNGNATIGYDGDNTYINGTTEVTERHIYISSLAFIAAY